MENWSWAVISALLLMIALLILKIYILKRTAKEIEEAFADRLMTDTNTLIDISSNDRHMRQLAAAINRQLRILCTERHRFRHGDAELKNAVTNISHDLRTPLTAICGYLDLLERDDKSPEVCRYIEVISNRIETLKQLTDELFQYSMIMTADINMQKENVVINSVLEESIAAFYTDLKERGITPDIQMCSKKVSRCLDHSMLSRVFSNLMNNAMKYSDGDLDIKLTEEGKIIFTNTALSLNTVQVENLFDRFYTVDTARKSTGLGLSIVRTLVEQMDGTVSAGYEKGRLSICIEFPEIL